MDVRSLREGASADSGLMEGMNIGQSLLECQRRKWGVYGRGGGVGGDGRDRLLQ
jgi:hypothetical protein